MFADGDICTFSFLLLFPPAYNLHSSVLSFPGPTPLTLLYFLTHSHQATRPGGKILLIGMGTPIQTLPISAAALREVDLVGVFRYADTYSQGVDIISKREPGDPDYGALVTHTFKGLDNADKAFDMAGRTVDEDGNLVIKVVLEMEESRGEAEEGRANL